jgi:tRNA modification GTPase
VKNKSDRRIVATSDRAEPVGCRVGAERCRHAALREAIVRALTASEPLRDTPAITNVRHVALARRARTAHRSGRAAAEAARAEEFIAADLQQARERLDEIVGKRTSDDVLRHIFERFCIGK